MAICDSDRMQAATEMAAAMRTLHTSPLTRARGENAANARLNAGNAVLCAYAAHRHLSGQATPPDEELDEELRNIARAHLLGEGKQTPVLAVLSDKEPKDCWAVDDSRGRLCYHCDHEGSDDRNFPCLSCPLVTRHLPNIAEPLNMATAETPTDVHPDPIAAVRDAGEVLDAIQRAGDALGRCPHDPELLATAIAMANAAYYTLAAVEWHPPHIGRRTVQRLAARELEIADGLYLAMGGDAEHGSIQPKRSGEPYCVRILRIPKKEVMFLCGEPEGVMPPEAEPDGETDTMCEHCLFRSHEHRPRIDQVAEPR